MNRTKIRICPEHVCPVGILSERPEFVCLSEFHRMEIEQTGQISWPLESKIEMKIESTIEPKIEKRY